MSDPTPEQRREWAALTDRLSVALHDHDVTIEVLDPDGGDASVVEREPFGSITYDDRDDVVVIAVAGRTPDQPVVLRHLIQRPREILADVIPQGAAVRITDASGTTTVLGLLRRTEHQDSSSG